MEPCQLWCMSFTTYRQSWAGSPVPFSLHFDWQFFKFNSDCHGHQIQRSGLQKSESRLHFTFLTSAHHVTLAQNPFHPSLKSCNQLQVDILDANSQRYSIRVLKHRTEEEGEEVDILLQLFVLQKVDRSYYLGWVVTPPHLKPCLFVIFD